MKILNLYIVILLITVSNHTLFAQLVTNPTQLQNAIADSSPGSTITLANGVWSDVFIDINKTATATNPITIKAQTTGEVFFEGNSQVRMGGAYIIFEGVVFQNPSNLVANGDTIACLLYTSPSPRDRTRSRMPSSA